MNARNKTLTSAHFDCQFGAAGDMLVAALLDAGVNKHIWLAEINKIALPPGSFQIRFEPVKRCSIRATKMEIDLAGEKQADYNPTFSPGNHGVTERAVFDHHKTLDHHKSLGKQEAKHGRHLSEILNIIKDSAISVTAKQLAGKIFTRLARAEAQVHGIPADQVHFHEVGALDAIVDIVGFAIAFDLAGIQQVSVSALPLGSGVVQTEHGVFPVPAPAVLKLLEDAAASTANSSIPFECLTPTGAAILCEIGQSWGSSPSFAEISASGYGAGSMNPQGWPNVARVILGTTIMQTDSARFETEIISVVEANIDDQSPQALAFAVDRILAAGALDVLVMPAMMKKGRSGHLLSVLCLPEDETKFQELVISETSSIGARSKQMTRLVAKRHFSSVVMDNGSRIRMKLACDRNGIIVNAQPEFDDLAKYAMTQEISIKEAHSRTITAFAHMPMGGALPLNSAPQCDTVLQRATALTIPQCSAAPQCDTASDNFDSLHPLIAPIGEGND